jgi:hypothetical protein
MNDNERADREQDRALERLAADLTDTAYAIALRHGAGGSWIDLELELWKALTGALREWAGRNRRVEMRLGGRTPTSSGS